MALSRRSCSSTGRSHGVQVPLRTMMPSFGVLEVPLDSWQVLGSCVVNLLPVELGGQTGQTGQTTVSWMFHASLGDFESSFHRTICHSYLRWSVFYQGTSRKHREYRTKERKSQCCHIFIILHISYILVFIFPHCDRAGHRLGSWVLPVELTCPDPRTTCGISVVLVYCQG